MLDFVYSHRGKPQASYSTEFALLVNDYLDGWLNARTKDITEFQLYFTPKMLDESVQRVTDASLKVLVALIDAQDHKVLARWTPQMTTSAVTRVMQYSKLEEREVTFDLLMEKRAAQTQECLKAMAKVFNAHTHGDWFNYRASHGQAGIFIEDLKHVEGWGFILHYRDLVHPSLMTQLLEI